MRLRSGAATIVVACAALAAGAYGRQYPSNPRGNLPLNGSVSGSVGGVGHYIGVVPVDSVS